MTSGPPVSQPTDSGLVSGEGFELAEVAFVWQPVGQVPGGEVEVAGGQQRGLVPVIAGGSGHTGCGSGSSGHLPVLAETDEAGPAATEGRRRQLSGLR